MKFAPLEFQKADQNQNKKLAPFIESPLPIGHQFRVEIIVPVEQY